MKKIDYLMPLMSLMSLAFLALMACSGSGNRSNAAAETSDSTATVADPNTQNGTTTATLDNKRHVAPFPDKDYRFNYKIADLVS